MDKPSNHYKPNEDHHLLRKTEQEMKGTCRHMPKLTFLQRNETVQCKTLEKKQQNNTGCSSNKHKKK